MKCEEFGSFLDGYLKGEMAEEKQEAFESHYFECDSCFADLKVRERLYSKEVPIVEGRKAAVPVWGVLGVFTRLKPALVMASVLVVAVASLLILQDRSRMNALYELSHFEPPLYIQGETRNALQDKVFSSAMTLYGKKQYVGALEKLKGIKNAESNQKVLFYKGLCSLLADKPGDAVAAFDVIIKDMNPSYYDEAIYYKGLALLRLGKKENALAQFKHLASMFSPFSEKAKKMIARISAL